MSESIPDKRPDKNSRINVIKFALMVSLICSLLITAAAGGLKGFQQENIELDRKINLLKAANLIDPDKKPPREQIKELYDTHIQEVIVDSQGKILTPGIGPGVEPDVEPGVKPGIESGAADALHLYFYKTDEVIKGYILPINSRGLWGKIQGYLAFENDGQTVSGFSVFSHSETPGLGGEIESAWFQKNFKGKKILNSQNKFVSVGIAKGKVANMPEKDQENYVDGISGATLTGKYLSEGIKSTLTQYEGVSITFRKKDLTTEEKN
jgi:Na+-transporting NADH:ubiquinone oxidoreductase subunit C